MAMPSSLHPRVAGQVPDLAGIRVVATDMDGTFLDPHHEPPPANLEAVEQLEAEGLHVVFCTGRNRLAAQNRLPMLDLNIRAAVFLNGAVVFGRSGTVIHERTVSKDLVVDVLKYLNKEASQCISVLCNGDRHFVHDTDHPWAMHLYKVYDDPCPSSLGGFDAALSKFDGSGAEQEPEPHLLHIVSEREHVDAVRGGLEALVGSRARIARSLPTCLTLLNPLCSKADGLMPVLRELRATPEETIAFGDAENDIEMLRAVRIGVAMGNAMDTVKAAADWTCGPNGGDPPGVAAVLRDLLVAVRAGKAAATGIQ